MKMPLPLGGLVERNGNNSFARVDVGGRGVRRAFTILELLVVISIIAIITGVALPSMKNIGRSNTIAAANNQLIDDLNSARQTAIAKRTTVHVLFVPNFFEQGIKSYSTGDVDNDKLATRLLSGAYTTYGIYTDRTIGDQPGQPHPRYLRGGEWKSLPDGIFVWPEKFARVTAAQWDALIAKGNGQTNRPFKFLEYPYPTLTGTRVMLPCITYSPTGSLITYDSNGVPIPNPVDEYLRLSRGSVLAVRDDKGNMIDLDIREAPVGNAEDNPNVIRIDAFTGRAHLQRPEIQ